ncbi:MAG: Uma2 family endonuclease [Dysgonamonadaceae bacterium]|jgi:Uma2 family endonuclease|nr:Uma2 family endonuclease [Dysgonamonadaceae bacterium]
MSEEELNRRCLAEKAETLEYSEEDCVRLPSVKESLAVYVTASGRYTYADYLGWKDYQRRELIHGVVHNLFSAPSRLHAQISFNLAFLFRWFIRKRKGKCRVFHAPFDVRLPKNGETDDDQIDTCVEPDICVICDPSKLDAKGCIGAPDLIVEVQSPSTRKRDLDEKLSLYESSGVCEYWTIDPPPKTLTVFLLQENGKYDAGTVYTKGKAPVGIFEGLKIDLKKLFEE